MAGRVWLVDRDVRARRSGRRGPRRASCMRCVHGAEGLRPSLANSSSAAVLALEVNRADARSTIDTGDLLDDLVEPRLAITGART